jgi:integrase
MTIVSRGTDTWLIGIDHGKDPATGKRVRRWHTFRGGKRQAQAEQQRLATEATAGLSVDAGKLTVGQLLQNWLADTRTRVGAKTHERRTELVGNVCKQLGQVRLSSLKPIQISAAWAQALQNGRRDGKGGLGARTVHHMHVVFKSALQWAVDVELLARNPAARVEAPSVPRAPILTYSTGDTAKLIAMLRQERIYIPTLLSAMTGARRGEVCALRWRDIDLDSAQMSVTRSVEQLNNRVAFKGTKTGRGRTIALGASVVDALRTWKGQQAEDLAKLDIAQDGDTLVCAHFDGTLMHPRWLSKRWAKLVKASGLPARGFHHLRHAHATALLQNGVHIKVASERLGHSTTGITLDLYSHVLPGMQEDAAARIDAAYQKAISGQ